MMALRSFRFKYDQTLEAVLAGNHRLLISNPAGPFETGRHILKIQRALLDIGYELPVHGADSSYGSETATAVSKFKTDHDLHPNDGVVGVGTMGALDAIFVDEVPFPTPFLGIGEMSLDDFIEAVQAAEGANPNDTPTEFLTRLRQLYYPGTVPSGLTFREAGFDRLLPTAPIKLPNGTRRILTFAGMDPIFFGRLSAHAPENPTPGNPTDNPSPYFYDATARKVDLGHLLLTLDALFHPTTSSPYTDFGIPSIDVASFVADLGIACVWAELNGEPDAPVRIPQIPGGPSTFDAYYALSAPDPDLLGDIDGFNLHASWLAGASLSQALIRYYLDTETAPGVYRQRFRMFMHRLFQTTDPDAGALQNGIAVWRPRVDRFNDLYRLSPFAALLTFTPPPAKHWVHTDDSIALFFQWLLDGLRIETDRFD